MPGDASAAVPPVGRAELLAVLRNRIDVARRDRGPAALYIHGVAGTGKTTLLDAVVDGALSDGIVVLRAGCGQGVADQPFGLVRALVDQLVGSTSNSEAWSSLRSRVETVRAALCDLRNRQGDPPERYALLHELCQLMVERAGTGPLMIAVDDLHGCDPKSSQWLEYLLRRTWGQPLILVAALRNSAPAEILDVVRAHISSDHGALVVTGPLLDRHIAELVEVHLGDGADQAFLDACGALSGRHVGVLTQLLALAHQEGLRPTRQEVDRLTTLAGRVIDTHVHATLGDPSAAVDRIALSIAVLGSTDKQLVSALSGASTQAVGEGIRLLRDHGLLVKQATPFPHELFRESVLGTAPAEEVGELRMRAARQLNDAGKPAETIARLLPSTALEPWMRAVFWDAAGEAKGRGDTDTALRYLWPLLEQAPGDLALRGQVVELLARVDPVEALRQLRVAIDMVDDPRRRATLAIQYGFNSLAVRRAVEGLEVLTTARAELRAALGDACNPADHELRTMLDAAIGLVGFGGSGTFRRATEILVDTPAPAGTTHAERLLLVGLALAGAVACKPVAEVAEHARRAVPFDDVDVDDWTMIMPALVLSVADEVPDALSTLDRALTRGDEQRPAWTYAFGLAVRALVRTVAGDFTQAAADAEQALRRADFERCRAESASLAAITLAIASVRLDDGARAREVLDGLDMARTSESPLVWHNYLMARAAVFADAGDVDAAVDCYHRCGRGLADAGIVNPLITEWWYEATLLLASHQRAQEAVALVRHGERLVQRWPVPRARGMALTARALVAEPKDRVGLLTEAVRVLGDTSAQFEHQRAELLLGRELLRRGDLVDARRHLRRASALAVHCGARTAAHAARELVLVAGGRMPSLTGARTDMLTSRELEVATRAAAGASNREIAENLFVTARTVEVHLTGAYRKLGIAGRDGLARALAHLDQDRDDEA